MCKRQTNSRAARGLGNVSKILQAGSGFIGGHGGLAVPMPTLGVELLPDPGLEQWLSATNLTNWSETIAGASTVNQETSIFHGGANSARLDVDSSNTTASVSTSIVGAAGDWVLLSAWAKCSTTGKTARMAYGASQADYTLTTAWQQLTLIHRYTGSSHSPALRSLSAASSSIYWDDASVKKITLASMFSAKDIALTDAIVKCKATIVAGARAGVVGWLDSKNAPANFLLAHHNGTNAILTKCVGGTYTPLIDTAAAYSAGAYVEIRRTAGTNTFALYYNGSKIGADQTVSDAGIISNTLAGYSNTYAGNTVSDFSAVAA